MFMIVAGREQPSSVVVIRARVMLIRTGTCTVLEFSKRQNTIKRSLAMIPSGCLPPRFAA